MEPLQKPKSPILKLGTIPFWFLKIVVDMHSQFGRNFCLCTTSPQKGDHVLFQFWEIWLLQRSIKQFLPVKCLVLFLVSSQACISSDHCVTQIINIPKKILCSADKNYRSFFSLRQSLAIGVLTQISRYGIFKCIFKSIFTI